MWLFNTAWPAEIDVYFRLVWLFVIIITMLMALLCYLYLSMRRAQEHESQSLAFSHLMIAGLETERTRISRELHDTVLPLLHDKDLAARVREICSELMPPDFTRVSLKDSLENLCAAFSGRTGIEFNILIEKELDLNHLKSEQQLHLYRMVQEALTNIEKHSGAGRASLVARRLAASPAGALICVSDDGRGIDGRSADTGLGMRIMRQRAAVLGAKLDFISEEGNGLMVRIEIPPHDEVSRA